jgi:lysophospholipase L1-like esterase
LKASFDLDKTQVEITTNGIKTDFEPYGYFLNDASNYRLSKRVTVLETTVVSKLKGKKSVHFGDSITGNYSAPVDYPTYIANATGLEVYNVGVGGTRMAYDGTYTNYDPFCMVKIVDALVSGDWTEQNAAYPNLTLQAKSQIDRLKTINLSTIDYATIWFGANDYTGTGRIENEANSKDITYYAGATRYVLEKLLTNYPQLKILLITPMYRDRLNTGDGLNTDDNSYKGFYMYQYADKIVEIAKKYHIPVLNMHDTSGINKFTAATYLEDGLHPSLTGRQLLGSKIAGELLRSY